MTVTDAAPNSNAIVEAADLVDVAFVNLLLSNLPGNIIIRNSTVQILHSNFTLNNGGTAGAVAIDTSRVIIDSTTFANNTGAASGALQVGGFLLATVEPNVLNISEVDTPATRCHVIISLNLCPACCARDPRVVCAA